MKKKIPAPRKLSTSPRCLFTFFNGPSRRVLYAKVTFANKLSSSLKIFFDKRNKIQHGLDNTYPENNQRVPRQRLTWKKAVQMSDFIS